MQKKNTEVLEKDEDDYYEEEFEKLAENDIEKLYGDVEKEDQSEPQMFQQRNDNQKQMDADADAEE